MNAAYWTDSVRSFKDRLRSGTAVIRLSAVGLAHYRQLTGERPFAIGTVADGWTTATVPIESIGHARGLFLQLGVDVEVLEPIELRESLMSTARELTALYGLTA